MRFSLVIPCYNEAANLPLLLDRCKNLVAIPDVEVILVDNGSTDNTSEVLENLLPQHPGCRSIRVEKNQGYGFGILSGLNAAEGQILGWTHADMQTDPSDAIRGLDFFNQNEVEIFVKGKRYGRPLVDVLFTVGMSVFETILLKQRMWDINAQPTILSRELFKSWNNPPKDFSLDLYAYYQAKKLKYKIHRFPVRFRNRAYGVSHWNINLAAKAKFITKTVRFSLQLKKESQ